MPRYHTIVNSLSNISYYSPLSCRDSILQPTLMLKYNTIAQSLPKKSYYIHSDADMSYYSSLSCRDTILLPTLMPENSTIAHSLANISYYSTPLWSGYYTLLHQHADISYGSLFLCQDTIIQPIFMQRYNTRAHYHAAILQYIPLSG